MHPVPELPPAEPLPPIPSPPGTLFREFRVTVLPYALFAVVTVAAALVWRTYIGPSALLGEVESVKAVVATVASGRLAQVDVGALDRVASGQVIAQILPIEPRVLDAQIALSKARIDFVRVGMDPDLRKQNNRINFENLRLDWMSKRVELAMAKSRLNYFRLELARTERLFAGITNANTTLAVASQRDLDIARRDVAATEGEIREQEALIASTEAAMKLIAPGEVKLDDEIPASVRAAIAVEERNLDLIEAQMAPVPLVAPFDGVVSIVHRRSGEAVQAGEPILTIAKERGERVVAYVRQPLNIRPAMGMKMEVRARSGTRQVVVGEVVRVGGQLEPIMATLLPRGTANQGSNPATEMGLPLLVSLPPELRVLPGEIVDLRLVQR